MADHDPHSGRRKAEQMRGRPGLRRLTLVLVTLIGLITTLGGFASVENVGHALLLIFGGLVTTAIGLEALIFLHG